MTSLVDDRRPGDVRIAPIRMLRDDLESRRPRAKLSIFAERGQRSS